MHFVENERRVGNVTKRLPMVAQGRMHKAMEWIVDLAGGAWIGCAGASTRRLRLVETLSLGAKKQLLLVSCDGESYLIGTGAESVQTITRVERRTGSAGPAILSPERGQSY